MNFFLIPVFGYVIAAYTTLFCYISLCLTHYYFYRRVCNEKLEGIHIYDRAKLLLLSVFMITMTFLILFSYKNIIMRFSIFLIIIFLAVYKRNKLIASLKFKYNKS